MPLSFPYSTCERVGLLMFDSENKKSVCLSNKQVGYSRSFLRKNLRLELPLRYLNRYNYYVIIGLKIFVSCFVTPRLDSQNF
jgi:hypothetical protein